MKKFFNVIGVICLLWFSFFYTEQTAIVVSELDELMVKIKEEAAIYKDNPSDATVFENTIIPGKSGSSIDIKKSYNAMRKIGSFDPKLFVYKKVKPKVSIDNVYDKYVVSGNADKKQVSLLFLITDNDNASSIAKTLESKNIRGTFFIDGHWFEINNDIVSYLIGNGHFIGNMSYALDYQYSGFIWMDTILKKAFKQEKGYCLKNGTNDLKYCSIQKNHTIEPKLIVDKNPTINICGNLENGAIIAVHANEQLYKELDLVISCIKNRGLELVSLSVLLEE